MEQVSLFWYIFEIINQASAELNFGFIEGIDEHIDVVGRYAQALIELEMDENVQDALVHFGDE